MTRRLLPALLRLAALVLLYLALVFALDRWMPHTDHPILYSVAIEHEPPEPLPEGCISLLFTGAQLFRTNVLYINHRRVPLESAQNIDFETCRMIVKANFLPLGEEIRFVMGKQYALAPLVLSKSNYLDAVLTL